MAELFEVKRDEDRRILTRGSLELFARFYFPDILKCEPADFHITEYNRFLPGKKIFPPKRLMAIWPRDHGKSQIFSVIENLWEVCTDPFNIGFKNIDIILITNTTDLSEKWMRIMEGQLKGNARLRADWGDLLTKAKVNNVGEKVFANGARLYARGSESSIRGEHPSKVHIDDYEDREDSQNPTIRKKLYDKFTQDVYPVLSPEASMYLIGTIVHEEGLLNTLWNNKDEMTADWTKVKYSAIKEDGTALWPSRWSLERLEKRRQEVKELAFSQEYLNLPLPSENPTIRPEWIQWYTKLPIHIREFDFKIVSVDAAFSEKRTADYTAIGAFGLIESGDLAKNVYVLDAERGHYSPKEVVSKVVAKALQFKARAIVIEAVSGSMIYLELLRDELRRRNIFDCEVWGVTPHESKKRKGEKMDKLSRLQSTAHLYQQELIHFPKHLQWLVNEILLMPFGSHDDGADMITWALRELDRREIRRIGKQRRKAIEYKLTGTGGY